MSNPELRTELIALVEQILRAEGTEEELVLLVTRFEQHVPHPEASDLIYYPSRCNLGRDPSAEEIVHAALSYRPIQL